MDDLLNTVFDRLDALRTTRLNAEQQQDLNSIAESAERLRVLLRTPETPPRLLCDCANAIAGYSQALLSLPYLYERRGLTSDQRAHLTAIRDAGLTLKDAAGSATVG